MNTVQNSEHLIKELSHGLWRVTWTCRRYNSEGRLMMLDNNALTVNSFKEAIELVEGNL